MLYVADNTGLFQSMSEVIQKEKSMNHMGWNNFMFQVFKFIILVKQSLICGIKYLTHIH